VADHERLAEVSTALANDTIEDFLNDHRVSSRRWGRWSTDTPGDRRRHRPSLSRRAAE
jgi:hypothetical protein